jgi:hypothetical protein
MKGDAMPVRDSTEWRHAIIQKKVINLDHDGNRHVMCAWDTCERDGFEMYKVRVKTHNPDFAEVTILPNGVVMPNERYMNYVFCSERHKQYWLASIRPGNNNNLPPGFRLAIV